MSSKETEARADALENETENAVEAPPPPYTEEPTSSNPFSSEYLFINWPTSPLDKRVMRIVAIDGDESADADTTSPPKERYNLEFSSITSMYVHRGNDNSGTVVGQIKVRTEDPIGMRIVFPSRAGQAQGDNQVNFNLDDLVKDAKNLSISDSRSHGVETDEPSAHIAQNPRLPLALAITGAPAQLFWEAAPRTEKVGMLRTKQSLELKLVDSDGKKYASFTSDVSYDQKKVPVSLCPAGRDSDAWGVLKIVDARFLADRYLVEQAIVSAFAVLEMFNRVKGKRHKSGVVLGFLAGSVLTCCVM